MASTHTSVAVIVDIWSSPLYLGICPYIFTDWNSKPAKGVTLGEKDAL